MKRALLLLLAGCSGAPLPSDLERAQRLEAERRDEEALAAYAQGRAACDRGERRPHDDCGVAATREAQLLERLGRDADAEAAWEALPARTTDPRKAARALARAAELADEKLHDPARAARIAWACVERYPDEVPADDALALALRIDRPRDARGTLQRIDRLAGRLASEDIADNLWFAGAAIALELDGPAAAVARYDELARRFPRSGLRDDALWRAAELLRKNGDPDGARKRLQLLLDTRRDALIVGSYNSLLLDDAQLLVGQIWLDDLHDPARAAEAFQKLADDYPDSTLRDDGLFELARARLALNDRAGACAALARLLREFPDGNRARAARDKQRELACP